jgi:hypothetical protein
MYDTLATVHRPAEATLMNDKTFGARAPDAGLSEILCKRCGVTSTAWGREMGTITHGEQRDRGAVRC